MDGVLTVARRPRPDGPAPRLVATRIPAGAVGVVLVLHGGGGAGAVPVSPMQLAVLRMEPTALGIARAGRGRVAVYRLLNAVRGLGSDPLSNVRWALEQAGRDHPGLPVCLIGHSLGGSVALAAAAEPGVRGVVALAPWLSGSESTRQLQASPTLIAHGRNDRITSCQASRQYAERARGDGAPVSFVEVARGEHTMLRRAPVFDLLAARYAVALLDRGNAVRRTRSRLGRLAVATLDEPGDYPI